MEVWHIWLIVAIVCFIIELFTPGFVLACFGIGCLFSSLAASLHLGFIWQLIFFIISVLITFYGVRPFYLKYLNKKGTEVKTNVDALIGQDAKLLHCFGCSRS